MVSQAERETAIRILGAADGYAHALIRVRAQIGNLMAERIPDHHTRRLAERDAKLRPLVVLCDYLELHHRECQEAYRKRMAAETN